MIITRTPFRLPLGGGGTDLPSYYSQYGGFIFSAGINKYMFINLNRPIVDDLIRLKYSKNELVEDVGQVQHELAAEALKMFSIHKGVEIVSMADIPAGTGMGSSSCYLVGLLKALHQYTRRPVPLQELAEEACRIELDILKKPIGKQDQYLAAYGGFTVMNIRKDGAVEVTQARVPQDVVDTLQHNILLFYTGISRNTLDILGEQSKRTEDGDGRVVENLHRIKEIGMRIKDCLERGDTAAFGRLLDEHWQAKRQMSGKISSTHIDRLYETAKQHGALGGKIVGAGGGGFLMLYCEGDKQPLAAAMEAAGLRRMRFQFDMEGSKVLVDFMSNAY